MHNFRQLISPLFLIMALSCHNNPNTVNAPAPDTASPAPDNANPAHAHNSTSSANPAPHSTSPASPNHAATKTIVFYGNSLTAGYGVNTDEAFPALIAHRIDSLHLPYTVVNAGVSGETSADGRTRIGWVLRAPVDIFVLELGGNDGLRGIPLSGTAANLQAIIDSVRKDYPEATIVIAGMQIPPSMGASYTTAFRNLFPKLSEENHAVLIPFLLQNVGGIPRLNQSDGIHPTAEGHRIVAQNVWQVLAPLLKK